MIKTASAGALLALACAALHGYSYAANGYHAQFLPLLFKLLRPELYADDAYVATLAQVPTLFWKSAAWLCATAGLGPQTVLGALFACVSWATWSVIYLLGLRVAGSARGAWAGCALALLCPYLYKASLLSTDALLRTTLDATSFCLPLALLGIWAALDRRPAAAGALLGLALWFQPLHGLSYGLVVGLFLLNRAQAADRKVLMRFALSYIVLALPILASLALRPPAAISSQQWADLIRLWYPWHYFAQWPWQQLAHIAAQGLLLGGALVHLGRPETRTPAARLAAIMIAVALASALLVKILPSRPLVSLQLLRLDGPAHLLLLLIAGGLLERQAAQPRELLPAALIFSALAEPLRLFFPAACAALLVWSPPAAKKGAAALILSACLGALAGVLPLAQHLTSTIIIALIATMLLLFPKPEIGASGKRLGSCVLAAALLWSLRDLAKIDALRKNGWFGPYPQDFQRAQLWVREHTPIDSLVLCFPLRPGLRVGFQRPLVGEWLDGAALNWAPDFAPAWKNAMKDLGFKLEQAPENQRIEQVNLYPVLDKPAEMLPVLEPWDAPRLKMLLGRYRPDIIVTPFRVSLPEIEMVYESGPFMIYRPRTSALTGS